MQTFPTALSASSVELNKYWALLTAKQRQSILAVIHSFISPMKDQGTELNEPEVPYNSENAALPAAVLQQLTWSRKEP